MNNSHAWNYVDLSVFHNVIVNHDVKDGSLGMFTYLQNSPRLSPSSITILRFTMADQPSNASNKPLDSSESLPGPFLGSIRGQQPLDYGQIPLFGGWGLFSQFSPLTSQGEHMSMPVGSSSCNLGTPSGGPSFTSFMAAPPPRPAGTGSDHGILELRSGRPAHLLPGLHCKVLRR